MFVNVLEKGNIVAVLEVLETKPKYIVTRQLLELGVVDSLSKRRMVKQLRWDKITGKAISNSTDARFFKLQQLPECKETVEDGDNNVIDAIISPLKDTIKYLEN